MAKATKENTTRKVFIKLKAFGVSNTEQKFEKQHALRLLRLPNSKWEIADGSGYIFSDNEIRRKPSARSNKKS